MNALQAIEEALRHPDIQVKTGDFILALILSILSALLIAWMYHIFYENRATGSRIHRSFLLLSPSITALFVAIQFSLPLSLGLVGALTIVRFRTPVKEPEEVAFIMLVIASSIVCATFHYLLLAILLSLTFVVLLVQKYAVRWIFRSKRQDGVLLLSLEGDIPAETKEAVMRILERKLENGKLQSISFADHVTTIHYSFTGLQPAGLDELTGSIKNIAPVRKLNVFFSR